MAGAELVSSQYDEKYYLITFEADWADEMNVYGFLLLSGEEWAEKKLEAQKYFTKNFELIWYIGTNEEIEINSYKEWESFFSTYKISKKSYEELKGLDIFPFGETGPNFSDYVNDE